jgi:hypothetical protein
MGYSAFVSCNCFKEGNTIDPPHRDFIRMTDEGINLDLDNVDTFDSSEKLRMYIEFDQWKAKGCSHENMQFANESIANISGMSDFITSLELQEGEMKFPVLMQCLESRNEHPISSEMSGHILQELLTLEKSNFSEEKVLLKLKDSDNRIQSASVGHPEVFLWSGYNKENFCIDEHGFFIVENRKFLWIEKTVEVFRSNEFKQLTKKNGRFCFVDILTGKEFISKNKILPNDKSTALADYHFIFGKEQVSFVAEYGKIIYALKQLTTASIETGNPIIWS